MKMKMGMSTILIQWHEKANPAYGVSIRPDDIMNDALQAMNDPQQRKDFQR